MTHQSRWLAVALIGALTLNLLLLPAGAAQSPLTIILPLLDLNRYERPPVEVKVRIEGDARGFRATLNGREVTDQFRPLGGGVLRATFTAGQLKHGLNRLEAQLGAHLATRTFRLRSLLGGAPAPGPQPTPTPTPPPYVPIQTRIITGDGTKASDYAIKVGDTTYTAPDLSDGSATGFQFLALDRSSLELVQGGNVSVPTYALFTYALPTDCGEYGCLLVAQSLQQTGNLSPSNNPSNINYFFATLGGSDQIAELLGTANGSTAHLGYSLISNVGPGGAPPGNGYERLTCNQASDCGPGIMTAAGGGAISGALILDNNGAYTFAYPGRATFSTGTGASTTQNTVTIGGTPNGQAYKSLGIENGSGAFQVVILYRDSLQLVYQNNFNFDRLANSDDWTMVKMLQDVAAHGNYLVIVSSIGNMAHDSWQAEWSQVGQAIEALGGTYSVFISLQSGDDYSFVGASGATLGNGAAEASSVITNTIKPAGATTAPSNLRGVLAQDRLGNYGPTLANLTSTFDQSTVALIDAVALQPPTPLWPVVNSSDPSAANYCDPNNQRPGDAGTCLAYRYLSQQLLIQNGNDIRAQYTNDDIAPSTWLTTLSNATYPGGQTFSSGDFDAVKTQLLKEIDFVADVRQFYTNVTGLYTQLQTGKGTILTAVYDDVSMQLNVDSKATVLPKWYSVFTGALSIAGAIASASGAGVITVGIDAALVMNTVATTYANNPLGQQLQSVEKTYDQLLNESADDFAAQQVVVGNLFDLILSDWGRLQALGGPLAGGQIQWDDKTDGLALQHSINRSLRREFFTKLIGAGFELGQWTEINTGAAPTLDYLCKNFTWYNWNCYQGICQTGCNTTDSDPENWLVVPSSPTGDGGQNYDIWLIATDVRCSAGKDSSLLGPLFAPLDPADTTKLGIYKPYFFLDHDGAKTVRVNESCPNRR